MIKKKDLRLLGTGGPLLAVILEIIGAGIIWSLKRKLLIVHSITSFFVFKKLYSSMPKYKELCYNNE